MVDDSKYVIVPNKLGFKDEVTNEQGKYVAELMLKGYRIIHKLSCRDAVHYVLIKFPAGSTPPSRKLGDATKTPTEYNKVVDAIEDKVDLDLSDIPF